MLSKMETKVCYTLATWLFIEAKSKGKITQDYLYKKFKGYCSGETRKIVMISNLSDEMIQAIIKLFNLDYNKDKQAIIMKAAFDAAKKEPLKIMPD